VLGELCTTRKTTPEFPSYSNEPSWDGFIMYKPYDDNKKYLKKIHVQIKGRKQCFWLKSTYIKKIIEK